MSARDRPASYYVGLDITDPTPYENDDVIFEGEKCMICGRPFYRGDNIARLIHGDHLYDSFLIHEQCLREFFKTKIREEDFWEVLNALGFDQLREVDY